MLEILLWLVCIVVLAEPALTILFYLFALIFGSIAALMTAIERKRKR